MKYFAEERRAVNYIIPELIATLQDDINNQKANGEPERDYMELEDKIKGIEEVQPVMEAGPELLEACEKVLHSINANCITEQLHSDDAELLSEIMADVYRAITKATGR